MIGLGNVMHLHGDHPGTSVGEHVVDGHQRRKSPARRQVGARPCPVAAAASV
ncbi:hypothetical protein ACFLIM_32810 [Nonomuraea sp. M3C6]|uniref:Uncharacterized protein n=1 Tax=Nonomuraea marmarensis TaxID=3351344 RepID=A0ABW7AKW0_9ACTN